MGGGSDPLRQIQLGPAKLLDRLDVPRFLLERQVSLQDDHIPGPADDHGTDHHIRGALIGAVKVPHPPQVSGRKPGGVRVCALQIFRSGHSRTFLRPAADHAAYLSVQRHLGQDRRHQRVQLRKQGGIVGRFSDVHGSPPFRRMAPDFEAKQRETREALPYFSLLCYCEFDCLNSSSNAARIPLAKARCPASEKCTPSKVSPISQAPASAKAIPRRRTTPS